MPVKIAMPKDHGHYFITCTCYKWLPLIQLTHSYDQVYKWFDYLKSKGHFITGYVIMPNHFHATVAFRKTGKQINKIIGDGKRFLSYSIVETLKNTGRSDVLKLLSSGVSPHEKRSGKNHRVWNESFDWKECRSWSFTKQKLDYMHRNPWKGKWLLSKILHEYPHSSAYYYTTGEQGLYEVFNFALLDEIDLSK